MEPKGYQNENMYLELQTKKSKRRIHPTSTPYVPASAMQNRMRLFAAAPEKVGENCGKMSFVPLVTCENAEIVPSTTSCKNEKGGEDLIVVNEIKRKKETRKCRGKAKSLGHVDKVASLRRMHGPSTEELRKAVSDEGRMNEIQAENLELRLKALAAAFSARTVRTRKKIEQPPTPSSEESEPDEGQTQQPTLLDRLRELTSAGCSNVQVHRPASIEHIIKRSFTRLWKNCFTIFSCNYVLDPQSPVYISWLAIVAVMFSYNAWVIPLRVIFPYQSATNVTFWIGFDCIADFIYLIDLFAFKPHVKFIQSGFWVKKPKETLTSYLGSLHFKMDLLALLPADFVAILFGRNFPLLRLPRILKAQTFWELFRELDSYLAHPHRARIFHTCLYMLYMIHLVACSYYGLSTWEGIGTTTWTFDGHGNAYVRCFYFATKTATSIGKNPKPENELEYMFMTFAWLSGVFVFAILIAQIRDIIATATKAQTEYRILTSAAISYLHKLEVPQKLQERVKLWLSYTWEQQKTLDETRILNLLPKTMRAEIALNIHVETLAKVQLFQNCETAFLRDLVVKLKSIIILPGDFICRKGEIGREMFIVKGGKIQVIGGPTGNQVLATLGEGSVFGEIALLGIGGMNKRTADVRAAGFVNLFVLSKADLNYVIRDYPEAQEILQRKAKKLLRESIKKAKVTQVSPSTSDEEASLVEEPLVIIKNRKEPPRLISTVLKLFPPSTKIGKYLTRGSKLGSSTDISSCSSESRENGNVSRLSSYPPSPFIPQRFSPDLDISIMTGDSLDEMEWKNDMLADATRCFSPSSPFSKENTPLEESQRFLSETISNRDDIPIGKRPPIYVIEAKSNNSTFPRRNNKTDGTEIGQEHMGDKTNKAFYTNQRNSPVQRHDNKEGLHKAQGEEKTYVSHGILSSYTLDADSE